MSEQTNEALMPEDSTEQSSCFSPHAATAGNPDPDSVTEFETIVLELPSWRATLRVPVSRTDPA